MPLKEVYNTLYHGDCTDVLTNLPPNSVQFTITSPPYRNAIDYNMHIQKNGYYRGKTIGDRRLYR